MPVPLEERFNAVVSAGLTSPLASLGFRKKGRVYTRQFNELAWMADIQRSRYNTRSEIQFTANCGIYVPQVLPIYNQFAESKTLTTTACCINTRIGTLAPDQQDIWWLMEDKSYLEEYDRYIVADIKKRVANDVMPFFMRFPGLIEVATFLKKPRTPDEKDIFPFTTAMSLGCAGILYYLIGKHEEAVAALALAVTDATGSPGERYFRDLQQRVMQGWKLSPSDC